MLKQGGTFLIVNETDGSDAASRKYEKIVDGMKIYTDEQIEDALKVAGFSKVVSDHNASHPWLTVIAEK